MLTPAHGTRPASRPASSSSTTSTTDGRARAGRPAARRRTPPASWSASIRNFTDALPRGHDAGDRCSATRARRMGSLAEPECRRIIAALDLAERLARAARVVRALGRREDRDGQRHREHGLDRRACCAGSIEFTQAGGEVNVVVTGINVGAQPYWNAEATMLMHTRGILVMTPESAMVLTGKQALDYSGGVSAEDNFGHRRLRAHHGPERPGAVLGAATSPRPAASCCDHYEHTYVAPGRALPAARADHRSRRSRRRARARTTRRGSELRDRRRRSSPTRRNPGRKRPFDIRTVMHAVDRPGPPAAGALAGHARRRDARWSGTRTSAAGRCA